jgi:tripartite-type tricarboxylate transporter receptor subunit TctC
MRAVSLLFGLFLLMCSGAAAETWPAKPVRIIASAAPGGGVDFVARVLAQALAQELNQSFVVEDRGGAGGTLATNQVAKSPADGYTLLVCSNGEITLAPYVQEQLPYDPVRELAPVVLVASAPQIIVVHPSVPAKDMNELITYARSKGALGYGTPGFGSSAHVGFELVRTKQNLPFFHVPYKGGGPAVSDLLGGQLQMAVVTIPAISAAVEEGLARAIAVLQPERSPLVPLVPSLKEALEIDMRDASSWFALMAPAGTPPEILAQLQKAAIEGLKPEVRARLRKAMLDVLAIPGQQFGNRLRAESDANAEAIRTIGFKPQ